MDTAARLKAVLARLESRVNRNYEHFELDRRFVRGAPAPQDAIGAVRQLFGGPLPPSYEEFLRIANGVTGFLPSLHVLSTATLTSQEHADWAKEFRSQAWEGGQRIAVEGFVVARGEGNAIILIDRTMPVDARGERGAVLWEYAEEKRGGSFVELLEKLADIQDQLGEQLDAEGAGDPPEGAADQA